MLKPAFKAALALVSRPMKFYRAETPGTKHDLKAASSNYFRQPAGPAEMVFEGREFIIDRDYLTTIGLVPEIKRGDHLVDDAYGDMAITDVREMTDLGGVIMGYRIRTEA